MRSSHARSSSLFVKIIEESEVCLNDGINETQRALTANRQRTKEIPQNSKT